jgi:hypothetical protein
MAAGALARWVHTWPGLGAVVVGMHAQGFDVELKQYPAGWRANFYPTGLNDSVVASAYEPSVPLYRRILEWRIRIRYRGEHHAQ